MKNKISKLMASGGVITAFVSSLCCIGPLALGVLGIGGASSLMFLEDYRSPMVIGVALFLTIGWIMNYRLEKSECCDESICVDPKLKRKRRISLSALTIVSMLFIFSPEILSTVSQAKSTKTATKVRTLYIEGMTCAGCELGVRKALERSGIKSVNILTVDHSTPNPEKNIGSAIINVSESLNCKIIKEIKKSPGYIAYWSLENKKPCEGK
jgi:mercuric ion transport protein